MLYFLLVQVVVLVVIPNVNGPVSRITKDLLKFVIFIQYVPRLMRIYPLFKEVTRTSGIFTETAWAGAAFNLFLYMLFSHVRFKLPILFTLFQEITCVLQKSSLVHSENIQYYHVAVLQAQ